VPERFAKARSSLPSRLLLDGLYGRCPPRSNVWPVRPGADVHRSCTGSGESGSRAGQSSGKGDGQAHGELTCALLMRTKAARKPPLLVLIVYELARLRLARSAHILFSLVTAFAGFHL